jgi:hypothetical protein
MNADYIVSQLESNAGVFREMFNNIPPEMIHWKSKPDKWNILEISCHLYDEEREDFRTRVKQVMENPAEPFPKIDPVDWVVSRNYNSKDFIKVVADFLNERSESVMWLKSLKNPPLSNAYHHPKFGPLSGIFLLSNWLAHDYLHFRQITKLKYDYLETVSGESLQYAGSW